jgi:hypothetical protein
VFSRKKDSGTESAEETLARLQSADGAAEGGKGRPTPKRKESEAARRQKMAPPKDRREAKARMKAEKSKERQQTMEALRGGDERRYPPRDQGKGRHLARNWIDGRRNIGEFFWPVVISALVLLFLPIPSLQQGSTVVLLGFYVLITVDTGLSLLGLRRALRRELSDPSESRGVLAYAFGRSIQSRKRRLPVPKVERGWTRQYTKGEVKAFTP